MEDVIIVFSNCDCGYFIVNGKLVGNCFEHPYEVGEALPAVFKAREHNYNPPIVIDLYDEDYFDYTDKSKMWAREERTGFIFSEEEINILRQDGDMKDLLQKFADLVIENIKDEEVDEDYD